MADLDPQEMAAQLQALREENEELKATARRDAVLDRVAQLSDDWGDQPAFLTAVRDILLSDDGGTALLLSEHDDAGMAKSEVKKMSATQIVETLLEVLPKPDVTLSEQAHQTTAEKPKADATDEVALSHDEQVAQAREWLAGKPIDTLKKEA